MHIQLEFGIQRLTEVDVDFCLIPLGTPTASVSKEVASVQRLLKKSGIKYSMHSAGTTLGRLHLQFHFRN